MLPLEKKRAEAEELNIVGLVFHLPRICPIKHRHVIGGHVDVTLLDNNLKEPNGRNAINPLFNIAQNKLIDNKTVKYTRRYKMKS